MSLESERQATYGASYTWVGRMLQPVSHQLNNMLMERPAMYWPWVAIVVKLCRLLQSPDHIDSWRDIAGFANLALRGLVDKESTRDTTSQ